MQFILEPSNTSSINIFFLLYPHLQIFFLSILFTCLEQTPFKKSKTTWETSHPCSHPSVFSSNESQLSLQKMGTHRLFSRKDRAAACPLCLWKAETEIMWANTERFHLPPAGTQTSKTNFPAKCSAWEPLHFPCHTLWDSTERAKSQETPILFQAHKSQTHFCQCSIKRTEGAAVIPPGPFGAQ